MRQNEIMEHVINVQKFSNSKSFEILRDRFMNLIHSRTYYTLAKFPSVPVTHDDLLNVLIFHFFELIKQYNPEFNKLFANYVKERLTFKAFNYMRELISKKHVVMNHSVALNDEFYYGEDDSVDESIETLNMLKNNCNNFDFLTKLEKTILGYMLNEKDIEYMSKNIGKSKSYIYKIKKSISKKLKMNLEL